MPITQRVTQDLGQDATVGNLSVRDQLDIAGARAVGGTGTPGRIPRWQVGNTLDESLMNQVGALISVIGGSFDVTGYLGADTIFSKTGGATPVTIGAGGGLVVDFGANITRELTVGRAVRFTNELNPAALGASVNDYSPAGIENAAILAQASTLPVNITGINTGAMGRQLLLVNVGANLITLVHESAASAAVNRFNLNGGVNIPMAQFMAVKLVWSGTLSRWVAVS